MKRLRKVVSLLLACSMIAGSTVTTALAASPTDEISEREIRNAELSRSVAAQGMVLLENENNALPIPQRSKIALYGGGAYATVKGGTGSGDVNQRYVVNVWDGLKNAGYTITSEDWLNDYKTAYDEGEEDWQGGMWGSFSLPDTEITDANIEAASDADTAVYVIARNSGEGADRKNEKGDYQLTDIEYANLQKLGANFENVVVVLNVGGIVDTKFFHEIVGLDSLLLMSQAGMEGGNALADVISGKVTPSGKLTDTWAVDYEDYPSSDTFSSNDGNTDTETYTDDIYVGYRYFDSFGVEPAYEFGFGLSYTTFDTEINYVQADEQTVTVNATITNTGDTYSGKEVLEVYFSAPGGKVEKPYQELAGYAKTDELAPGAQQTLTVSFPVTEMSSYDEDQAAYILERGMYTIQAGNSSRNTVVGGVLNVNKTVVTEQLSHQLALPDDVELEPISPNAPATMSAKAANSADMQIINLDASKIETVNNASPYDDETVATYRVEGEEIEANSFNGSHPVEEVTVAKIENPNLKDVYDGKYSLEEFVAQMSVEQLATLAEGIGWSSGGTPVIGSESDSVPGAAGETTKNYLKDLGIPNIVLADGPAGVRISQSFEGEDAETGETQTYYQFCTAWPIGTLLAQTWDKDLIEEMGKAFGEELEEMGVTLLLAPGMNIHRNPLCGRNFEYYSEDPLVAGMTAAYETRGVQSNKGVGVTLKHYAANNQENNRNAVDTFVTERALREIYLKGFEIAVKNAQPMALMTSYNLINHEPAADSYDLCTDIARGEWGFEGVIMTDWGGGQSHPDISMHAGNDLIMPGGSTSTIISGAMNVPAKFNEDGSIAVEKVSSGWGPAKDTEMWNDFVPVKYAQGESCGVQGCTETTYKHSHDASNKIVYEGSYKEDTITKGDIQKSAINILNIIMQSNNMGSVHGVEINPYLDQFDDLKEYITVEKSDVLGGGYTMTQMPEENGGWWKVENKGGATLGVMDKDIIIEKDGYAFKDLNGNGKVDIYEDWRLDTEVRAQDLAEKMVADGEEGIAAIAGLMLYSSHQSVPSEDLTEAQQTFLRDDNVRAVLITSVESPEVAAKWNNNAQAFVEGLGYGIPINTSSDPRHGASGKSDLEYVAGQGGTISLWPDSIGLAATFDPEIVERFGDIASQEYRALGIATALSPQIDLATEPRWSRVSGTFGENSDLDTDMARAYVDGFQTTYDTLNPWGDTSVNAMVKHWPSGGPEEGGRDGHYGYGKYAVYPGDNLEEQIKPFVEGAFDLNNGTDYAAAVMPYYTISYNQAPDGTNVGNSYNKYIITDLLREKYGYDGVVCTDWMITADAKDDASFTGKCWGVEDLTVDERHYLALQAGVDQFGGNNDKNPVIAAYNMWVEDFGKESADQRFEDSARRLLRNIFNPGLFENPYLDPVESTEIVGNETFMAEGYDAQVKSVVMLKDTNGAIVPAAEDEKETVYLPKEDNGKYCMNEEIVSKYYDITDNPDEADFAIVAMDAPNGGSGYSQSDLEAGGNGYVPITLQYGEYTADTARDPSIAADPGAEFIDSETGEVVYVDEVDNRSYKGKTVTASNYSELEKLQETRDVMGEKPVVAYVKVSNPMVFSEVEPLADAIVLGYGIQDQAAMEIISGTTEPSGLLPMQQPANMETVEAQFEDVPQDMECYVDSQGNTYDFGYGLNWSGQIFDERTEKYADFSGTDFHQKPVMLFTKNVKVFVNGEENKIAELTGRLTGNFEDGEEVTVTFQPYANGREFSQISLNGKNIDFTDTKEYSYTFTYDADDKSTQRNFAFVIVDKQVLKVTIDAANACGDEVAAAIPEVQEIFNTALDAANKVYGDIHATQAEIDEAWSNLMDALHLLSFEEGDTSALENLIEVAELMDLDEFFGDKDAFAEALAAAKELVKEEHPLAAEVDEAYNNLYNAIMGLTRVADKDSLQAVVDKAKSLDLSKYIDNDAKAALPAAIEAAQDVLNNEEATQDEVDEQAKVLNALLMDLRKKADKSELNSILSKAQAIDTSKYTAKSVAALEDAIDDALAVIDDKDLTEEDQAVVDRAAKALNRAYNGLVEKNGSSSSGSSGKKSSGGSSASTGNTYGSTGTAVVGAATAAQNVAKVVSDTTVDFTLKRGSAYCFKMTVTGTNVAPNFTVGNGSVLKTQFLSKIGNDYYYRVYAVGTPGQSTGVYTTLAGQNAVKHCTVTVG